MWTPTRFVRKSANQRAQPDYLTTTPILDSADWRKMRSRLVLEDNSYDSLKPLNSVQERKFVVADLTTKGAG